MDDGFSNRPSSPETPGYLAQLPTAPRTPRAEALDQLRQGALSGPAPTEPFHGTEYLLFSCTDTLCAIPLTALREVRLSLPPVVSLPFSPDWLIGIFPLRTQLLGLVDPTPLLFGSSVGQISAWYMLDRPRSATNSRRSSAHLVHPHSLSTALLIGEGEGVLALAVSAVGDIVLIPDEQIVPMGTMTVPVAARYVAGIYAPAGGERRYIILEAGRLLADLLAGLEEKERSDG